MRPRTPNEHRLDTRPRPSVLRIMAMVVLPLIVLAAAVAVFVLLQKTRPEVATRPPAERTWTVSVTTAEVADHTPRLQLFGEARAGRQVELRALVAGEVIETGPGLREGAEVAKGELLLQIDPFDYEAALAEARASLAEARGRLAESRARVELERSQLEAARRQLELARVDLDRAAPLVKRKLLSEKAEDDRRVLVSQREQAVSQRENAIAVEQARADQQEAAIERLQTAVRRAERALANTRLDAPFDAYVSGVNAQVGRLLSVNDRVATLIDRSWIDVRFTLSDAQYGRLIAGGAELVGRPVEVVWRVGGEPVVYQARIERVTAEISAASGGVDLYARVVEPDAKVALRPGAFVELRLDDATYNGVVRLPETALYEGDTVYVVKDGRLAAREVEPVGYAGTDVLLRGELAAGEQVLTTRISEIGEGLKVEVR